MDGVKELHVELNGIETMTLSSDRVRLKMILRNLFSNAIKFRKSGHKPLIKVSTKLEHDKLVVLIEDNGEGIAPEIRSKIFEMFFRGHERSNGSGLGLYIAKEAARRINCEISVESEFGKGSTFSLIFPPS